MQHFKPNIRINKVSLTYKKTISSIMVLLSLMSITNVQASRHEERMPMEATAMTVSSAGNENRPDSPFSVDRDKSSISSSAKSNVSERKSLLLRKDGLLSRELESWVNQSGYTLLWNSNRDYIIYNTITLHADNFDNVLNELGKLFDSENYGLVIKQYEVNKVIIVDAQ